MFSKAKKNYFNNLNARNIMNNKQFWKIATTACPNNVGNNERIVLIEERTK